MNPRTLSFADDGDVPNHPRWPVLHYPRAVDPDAGDTARAFEALFRRHGWGGGWRNGIYSFTHYHAAAHEVLGIARGTARVQLGGDAGAAVEVAAGDVVLLPAGTGHRLIASSGDLLVVGAYPPGQEPDIRRAGERDAAGIRASVAAVPKPAADPVGGRDGPVATLWR
jgi:uncharacterized protein YjlB